MSDNEFFRQATIHICGNLVLTDAMFSIFRFLRKEMPVDRLYLQFHEVGLNALRIIAMATEKKAMKVDLLTPLSAKALQELKELNKDFYQQKKTSVVWLFKVNPIMEQSTIREVFELHNLTATSLMVMPLLANNKFLGGGSLVLITEGREKFTQQHADLLSMLKEPFSISMSNALKHRELEKLKDILADDNQYLHRKLQQLSGDIIIGEKFGLKEVMKKVHRVTSVNSPVLLLGETGVGKDVIANAIHYSSPRTDGPFIKVNCGAIPDTLIDSELFGHEKGAFTGALSEKRGRFERADKGTIFLDEIGELPPQAQVRLLRVLQYKEIERVGSTKTITLDIRIIAATNRDLEEMVKMKQFREDLWFRINVFPITIPPLRERKVDIPALVQHFINMKVRELKLPIIPVLAPGAINSLMEYHWPGNIRELQNIVERALILSTEGVIYFDHLNSGIQEKIKDVQKQPIESDSLDELISSHIQKVLTKTNGKINGPGGAAELLGINPNTLRARIHKLGITYKRV